MTVIGVGVILVFVVGPLLLGAGAFRTRTAATVPGGEGLRDWHLTACSALLYTLAFNLTFFLQELFLVLPKALTPGLHPILYHNNHTWSGDSPHVALLQGSGALAIFVSGVLCAVLTRRGACRSRTAQLFLVWMAYCGLFESLPQVVVGALVPQNDVGMALRYLGLGAPARTAAALVALLLMAAAAWRLTADFLGLATVAAQTATARARLRFIFQLVTVPALAGIALIVPYRVPREAIEVLAVPAVVSVLGTIWIQACAWRRLPPLPRAGARESLRWPLGATVALLLLFQLILRRGIAF
ncbi:MAG TPA: hypothetical protein VFO23_02700 [Steroidobacteraceae bacterium]|nr:hypothetical protein [Steroidobacteraceae bacterium]